MSSSFLWEDNLIDLQNGHLRNDYVQLFYQSNYRIMTENCHGRLYNNRQVGWSTHTPLLSHIYRHL